MRLTKHVTKRQSTTFVCHIQFLVCCMYVIHTSQFKIRIKPHFPLTLMQHAKMCVNIYICMSEHTVFNLLMHCTQFTLMKFNIVYMQSITTIQIYFTLQFFLQWWHGFRDIFFLVLCKTQKKIE